jgi:hypothetical protein
MKVLGSIFIGFSIGMLSPIENTLYCLIPLSIGIFLYYFEIYDNGVVK